METMMRCALAAVVLAPLSAPAETACFSGGDESGSLAFAGAVEGTGFTGRFDDFSVTYCLPGSKPAGGTIRVEVELASADTGNGDRDQALKGPEFFAVGKHPLATWASERIEQAGAGYTAAGELTLKGITAAQAIRFTLEPDGDDLVARGSFTLDGSAEVDRQRFGVGTGEFADPEFVRNRVDVTFRVLLVRDD